MSISPYLRSLRQKIGSDLLLLPSVAAIVPDENGRILLQLRSDDGQWSLPAGAIEPGEAPAQACIREVWEESGLHVVPQHLAGVFGGEEYRHTYPNGDQVEYTVLLFVCQRTRGKLKPRDDESVEVRYFAPDKMPPLVFPYPRSCTNVAKLQNSLF